MILFVHTSHVQMAGRWVEAAGQLVMEVVQSEWEPLSHSELEQRLDQAVEEILEADLMSAGVQGQEQGWSGDVLTQLSQPDEMIPHTVTSHSSAPAASFLRHAEIEPAPENFQHISEIELNPTVQVSLLTAEKVTRMLLYLRRFDLHRKLLFLAPPLISLIYYYYYIFTQKCVLQS